MRKKNIIHDFGWHADVSINSILEIINSRGCETNEIYLSHYYTDDCDVPPHIILYNFIEE